MPLLVDRGGLMPESLTRKKNAANHRKGGRLQIGMVAGFISERWPTSNRNPGRLHVGTPGRIKSESALLYVAVREQEGREASPSAAIIDSQSAKAAQKGASLDPQGDVVGKKVTGRKRHSPSTRSASC